MADAIAAAAERRSQAQPVQTTAAQLSAEHERRQLFRRLIDPGISRPNSKEQYFASLKVSLIYVCMLENRDLKCGVKTLSTIAENLLKDPDNPKFRQFKVCSRSTHIILELTFMKPTNTVIKKNLVETKGALEYAIQVFTLLRIRSILLYDTYLHPL